MKCQKNGLFLKSEVAYDKYEPSPFYKYKISKLMSKHKLRYFLKLRLLEPPMVESLLKPNYEKPAEYHLEKAITYSI